MSILHPGALAFLAAVPVIIVFYILRAQHNRQLFPSTRFWRELPSDLEGRPTWRRPLRNLLLLLQLLIALLAALALIRPVVLGEERRHVIILLDASASMQSADISVNRFEEAERQVRTLVGDLLPGDDASLIRVGRVPEILASGNDRQAIISALDAAQPASGSADYAAALALAGSVAERYRDWRNELVVVSDGAFPTTALARASGMPYPLRVLTVGNSDNNQAITELSVRPSLGSTGRYVGFVKIANYANRPVTVPFVAQADGLSIDSRPLEIPAQQAKELTLALPAGTKVLDVALQTGDVLPLDDHAQVLVGTERQRTVLVVSANPPIWDKVLQAVPLIHGTNLRPSQYKQTPADITVFDGYLPRDLPPGNLLLLNPPSGHPALELQVVGETGPIQAVRARTDHPVLDAADLTALYVNRTKQVVAPKWADVLLESGEWPLILAGHQDTRRVVILTFDPLASELPQRIAFPVLMNNVMNWLTPDGFTTELKPGAVIDLVPAAEAKELVIRLPSGKAQVIPVTGKPIRFAGTDAVGRYTVLQMNGTDAIAQQTFIVNATDELESDIRPREHSIPTAANDANLAPVTLGIQQELWPWLAAIAFVVLGFEWWYYCRRWAAT